MLQIVRRLIPAALVFAPCVLSCIGPVQAQNAADKDIEAFYRGKTIQIIVGSSAGGGYDTYARMIARYFGKHVAGNPNVIVSNMPGAGGNVAANSLYNISPKDGTVIGAFQSGVILEPVLGLTPVKHDPSKFHYLGSANDDVYICIARSDSNVQTFDDVLKNELIVGASGSSSTSDYPAVLNAVLGSKFKIVLGYPGSREISLAIEKGEAQGACGLAWPSIAVTQQGWFDTGKVKVIVQTHAIGYPELNAKGIPLAATFAKTDDQRAMLALLFSQSRFGRPYVLAPEVPAPRVAALRKAFADTMVDPELKAEAAKMKLDIDAVPGADVEEIVRKVYASPPDIIARTKQAVHSNDAK
jgi:tripartite-type tricarboxylate transporter receptor subunit TctC